jgi:hypothetical protein
MINYNRIKKYEDRIYYYLNDKLHRIDGPAIENICGDKWWYQNNLLHRIDGPAVDHSDGHKAWFKNGRLHRLDGPAVEFIDGEKHWSYEGELVNCTSQEEFERYLKLKLFW